MMKRFFSKENMTGLLLLLLAVAAFCCLMLAGAGIKEPVPQGGWQERALMAGDGCTLKISSKRALLYGPDGEAKWSPAEGLLVQDGLVTDLDGDGRQELILLLWRAGKYGKHRPFWEKNYEDGGVYSQHIFIYELFPEYKVKEKWCASDVGREIVRFKLMEKNSSILLTEDTAGACNLWRWDSFGLKMMENGAKIVAFGDNIIHKEIYEYAAAKKGGSYDFLYEPFYEDIRGADLAVFQQETMLVDKESAVSGFPMFGSPLAVGEAIAAAGFDVACCGGNHALDKGIYGIDVTTSFYRDKGVLPIGVHGSKDDGYKPFEKVDRNGISFALLDYTYGTGAGVNPEAVHYLPSDKQGDTATGSDGEASGSEGTPESLVEDIEKAGEAADFVIVFVHWGDEYEKEISEYQKWITGLLAEGGADLVIGTHPHVLQDVETVKRPDGGDMLVYYSLGNFRAYQGKSEDTRVGGEAVVQVEHCYDGVRIADHELRKIDAYVKPGK